ncbi:MAG: dimethylargininase [Acidobacteria bacterium]|nr:dimethylargininase [Acidobacteriota bacterium]MBV9474974.1 dimethylargininase [Acidobacteriota bacterium]
MIAVTREVSPSIDRAEVTHIARTPIDYARAVAQHRQYLDILASLGFELVELPGDEAFPDCVFVEDTAVVLDDVAVIMRPGAESRRDEVHAIAPVLARYRPLAWIEAPATIDGGDVLLLDDRIFVGLSHRTNETALAQLRERTHREVIGVPLHGCLHLKTAITRVGPNTLLVDRSCIDVAPFAGFGLIDAEEPFAANALLAGDAVIYPTAFPKTRAKLEARGIDVRAVDADELAKAEGGVTCCAILIR